MDLPIESLLHLNKVEYLILDAALRIRTMSPGACRLALDPAAVSPGIDVRMGFPEFVGAEKELNEVMSGTAPHGTFVASVDPTTPPLRFT